jgi:hypothetical protein
MGFALGLTTIERTSPLIQDSGCWGRAHVVADEYGARRNSYCILSDMQSYDAISYLVRKSLYHAEHG